MVDKDEGVNEEQTEGRGTDCMDGMAWPGMIRSSWVGEGSLAVCRCFSARKARCCVQRDLLPGKQVPGKGKGHIWVTDGPCQTWLWH